MLPTRVNHGVRALRAATASVSSFHPQSPYTTSAVTESISQNARDHNSSHFRVLLAASLASAALYHVTKPNLWKADEGVEETQETISPEQDATSAPSESESESALLTQILHKLTESQTTRSRALELIELEALLETRAREKYEQKKEEADAKYRAQFNEKRNEIYTRVNEEEARRSEEAQAIYDEIEADLRKRQEEITDRVNQAVTEQFREHIKALEERTQDVREKSRKDLEEKTATISEESQKRIREQREALEKLSETYYQANRDHATAQKRVDVRNVQRIVDLLVLMQPMIEQGRPFHEELMELRRLTGADPLMRTLLTQIPDVAARRGVSTIQDLSTKFRTLKNTARGEAFIPEKNFFWNVVSLAVSKVSPSVQGLVEGNDPDAILARAEYFLARGQLPKAIGELRNLPSGAMKNVLEEWISAAERRLVVEQSLSLLHAHLIHLIHSQVY